MKLLIKDIAVLALTALGILGSINWLEIPFWVFLVILVAYAGVRLADKDSTEV